MKTEKREIIEGESPMVVQRRKRGFTLIELLLVMFILVVLASIAAPIYFGRKAKAEVDGAKTQIDLIKTAITNYNNDVGSFPTESQGLDALVHQPDGADDWHGPYMEEIPLDPWKNPYVYKCPGSNGTAFDIISFGPDKQEGTADDISNHTPK